MIIRLAVPVVSRCIPSVALCKNKHDAVLGEKIDDPSAPLDDRKYCCCRAKYTVAETLGDAWVPGSQGKSWLPIARERQFLLLKD